MPGTVLRPIGISNRMPVGSMAGPELSAWRKAGMTITGSWPNLANSREAAAHVAQPARLAERHRLGGGKEDFHSRLSDLGGLSDADGPF